MKVSIKEIKIEDDGSEILYMRDVGFILKSETFSGPLKRCLEKRNEKEKEKEKEGEKDIGLEAFIPSLTQIISQITTQAPQHQAGAEASGGEVPQQTKESAEEKKKPE